ncbi:hypothetical protein GCM10029978_117190 [Actinoallomurus acanthiterrae]
MQPVGVGEFGTEQDEGVGAGIDRLVLPCGKAYDDGHQSSPEASATGKVGQIRSFAEGRQPPRRRNHVRAPTIRPARPTPAAMVAAAAPAEPAAPAGPKFPEVGTGAQQSASNGYMTLRSPESRWHG